MKIKLVCLLIIFAFCIPAAAQVWGRPHRPHDGACFYKDRNFRGDFFCMRPGERFTSLPPGFNDSISSIRVFGNVAVRVFNDFNFQGPSMLVREDVPMLRDFRMQDNVFKNWGDRISSIVVFGRDHDDWAERREERGREHQDWDRERQVQDGACFFRDRDFQGEYFCVRRGERMEALPPGFTDQISSIRVFGGAVVRVFEDRGLRGYNLFLDGDARNLHDYPLGRGDHTWNDRIASVVVFDRDRDEWREHRDFEHRH